MAASPAAMTELRRSVLKTPAPKKLRNVKEVPFVELYGGRVQGVVRSGSDEDRVYVCFVEAGTGNHACNTNNNRPCSQNYFCKHRAWMLSEAMEHYGAERVARYLNAPGEYTSELSTSELLARFPNAQIFRGSAPNVFSRFLSYLRYVELQASLDPMPEMSWFIAG